MAFVKFSVLALACLLVLLQSGDCQYDTVTTCPLTDQSKQGDIFQKCLNGVPELKSTVESIMASQGSMGSPVSIENLDPAVMQSLTNIGRDLCSKTDVYAAAMSCITEEIKQCLPGELNDMPKELKDTLMELIPTRDRYKKALLHVCDMEGKFTEQDLQCFTALNENDATANLQQCMTNEMAQIMSGMQEADEIKERVCRVPEIMDNCLRNSLTSCNGELIETTMETVNILLACDAAVPTGASILLLIASLLFSIFQKSF